MNAPLYTTEILRLAASIPDPVTPERVDGTAEERAPTCGSTVRIDVQVDDDNRVKIVSQRVSACAFGQASAALLAAHAQGRSLPEVRAAMSELSAWLAGDRPDPGGWPGLEALAPARLKVARHGAILLPFKALVRALESAGSAAQPTR